MASPGKVLIIVQNLPVPFDRRVWLEAITLLEAGYQVSIISIKGKQGVHSESYIKLNGINIYRYKAPPEAQGVLGYVLEFIYCWLTTLVLAIKVFFRHGFDVIHACNPPDTYFLLGFIFKVLLRKRFLFDHHDLSPEMYIAKGGNKGGMLHRGLLLLERLTFKTADVIITTNQSHKEIAVSRGGVEENDVFIVRSGPDYDRLTVLPAEPELKQGFPFMACYLGEMCSQDGVDGLLRSISIFINGFNRKDTFFVFLGGGPELEFLKVLSQKLNLSNYVRFLGRVTDHDLCRYLSTADICLEPDPYTEWSDKSTMNKVGEYMTFGKPIVAYDLKENRFTAQDAAVYVEPNNEAAFAEAMVNLLNDPTRRKEMRLFGKDRVQSSLSWQYSEPVLLSAYQRVFEADVIN